MEGEASRVLCSRMPGTIQPRVMASRRVRRVSTPLGFNKWKSGIPLPPIATLGIPFYQGLGTPISCLVVTVVENALDGCVASRQVRGPDLHAWDRHPPELSMMAPQ